LCQNLWHGKRVNEHPNKASKLKENRGRKLKKEGRTEANAWGGRKLNQRGTPTCGSGGGKNLRLRMILGKLWTIDEAKPTENKTTAMEKKRRNFVFGGKRRPSNLTKKGPAVLPVKGGGGK